MKVTTSTISRTLSLEANNRVVWEEKQLVSDVDHPEKKTSHREEGGKTHFRYVVCDIHHGWKS
jgi:hypothetical protein